MGTVHPSIGSVWTDELDKAFADVAPYYDKANLVASLGLWSAWRRRFVRTMTTWPGARILDVCAGTNVIGIELLKREPELEVIAIDRSREMQEVGQRRARERGMLIETTVGDVHALPFPDEHFDLVTLQFASRHLRLGEVLREIQRVRQRGGHFHHCDMLRPDNRLVEEIYYVYLRGCLNVTACSSTAVRRHGVAEGISFRHCACFIRRRRCPNCWKISASTRSITSRSSLGCLHFIRHAKSESGAPSLTARTTDDQVAAHPDHPVGSSDRCRRPAAGPGQRFQMSVGCRGKGR